MKHPKKYLDKSGSQMFDVDMMFAYQNNPTPAMSCSSRSSGASSGHQPSPKSKSFLRRNFQNFFNHFSSSSAQQPSTQDSPEDEQKNAINVPKRNYIPPQAAQTTQVQQTLQQPTQTNVLEPDLVSQQSSETPELPLEAQQQTVPEEALQQSAEEPTQPIASNEKKVLNKL